VSQALARAAERAEAGGGGVTQTPGGVTVIDGGTTMTVNGQQVPADEVAATLGSLPGLLGTAFRSATAGGSGPIVSLPESSASSASALPRSAAPTPDGSPLPGTPDLPVALEPGSAALPGRVSLDTITDTGVDVGGNRLYTFDLTVSIAGRAPYQVKHAAVVPRAQVPRLLRGASFPAQIDPSQQGQIAIAWDR